MSDRELRLRLQVRRHGLPEVNLLWNTPAGPDSTIAKLVEKVNEVLPLEGDDWGLEDYVVELKGSDGTAFECLHFQQVSKVLKDDDQVIIRSLLSDDLRLRRASGRHQITADGRHLVDGVAYGRRWLNAPRSRPLVTLPPRKRAKVEIPDDYDDEEDEEAENPLLLEYHSPGIGGGSRRTSSVRFRADFDDADDIPEDDDFEPGHVDADEPASSVEEADHADRGEESDWDEVEDDLTAELEALREDLTPEESFDLSSLGRIEKTRLANNGTKSRLRKRKALEISSSPSPASDSDSDSTSDSEVERTIAAKLFGIDKQSDNAPASSSSSSLSSDESDDSDSSASSQPNLATGGKTAALSSSDSSSEESSEDESDGDGTVIRHKIVQNAPVESSEDSSDSSSESSSSESDSDSEPEEVSSKPVIPRKTTFPDPSSELESADVSLANTEQPPGQGMRKTQRRNLRRRLAKQHASGKAASDSSNAMQDSTPDSSVAQENEEFLARKKALLEMMDMGTLEKAQRTERNEKAVASNAAVPTPYAPGSFPVTTDDSALKQSKKAEEASQSPAATQEAEEPSPSAPRRLRLNVNAGRRMLFGALGLRNPKSKADEDKLRGDLMKNVRPHQNPRTDTDQMEVEAPAEPEAPKVDEDPDAWRKKINYRAVECCDEGIELSEPPFPFVQRWDPQQQYQSYGKKGGKRKRNTAHQTGDAGTSASSKKQRTAAEDLDYDESWAQAEDDTAFDDTVLTYDDPPSKLANDSQFSDFDDLPSLPANLAALTDLKLGDAIPGMVITWKHFLLSAQTNWQPEMVSVTAIVVKVEDDDGKCLRLLLAKRDRALEQSEKVYDEHTGERIYDRFEAPDMDEDGDEPQHDDGYREIDFAELVEPKIIQQPLGSQEAAQAIAAISDNIVAETQYNEVQCEAPTSAQAQQEADILRASSIHVEEPSEQQLDAEAGEPDDDTIMSSVGPPRAAKSPSLGHENVSKAQGRDPNSPSRQLHEMSTTVAVSDEEAEITVVVDTPNEAQKSPSVDAQEEAEGGQEFSQDSVNQAAESVNSESASVPSGRQPDPHVSLNLGHESPAPAINGGEDDISQDPTPAAEPSIETPRQTQPDHTPSSEASFPPLDEIWATATTSRANLSPSKAATESALKGRGMTAPLEARFQLIEDMEDASSPITARKQLFPNSTQPTTSSLSKKRATQPFALKKGASAFVVPEGSQVVALSSDSSSPDKEVVEEDYAEDEVDTNYKGKRGSKGTPSTKKTTRQSAKKAAGKQKQRVDSTPSGSQRKSRRRSLPAAVLGTKKGSARRATSAAWEGEI